MYLRCLLAYARWESQEAIRVFAVVLLWRLSSSDELTVCLVFCTPNLWLVACVWWSVHPSHDWWPVFGVLFTQPMIGGCVWCSVHPIYDWWPVFGVLFTQSMIGGCVWWSVHPSYDWWPVFGILYTQSMIGGCVWWSVHPSYDWWPVFGVLFTQPMIGGLPNLCWRNSFSDFIIKSMGNGKDKNLHNKCCFNFCL